MASLSLDDVPESLGGQPLPGLSPSAHPHPFRVSADPLLEETDEDETGSQQSFNTVDSSNILVGADGPSCPVVDTRTIDESALSTSLETRVEYVRAFLNFGKKDEEAIRRAAPLVEQLVPKIVDDMYAKLFEFDVTKCKFMERGSGYNGVLPNDVRDLHLDNPQITFRKVFLKSWARRMFASDYTSMSTWEYMDKVGIMHTGESPFKHQRTLGIPPLNVPYRDTALTLGWVQTVLQTAVLKLPEEKLSMEHKIETVEAITRVIWAQNDLFARHYIEPRTSS